MQIKCKYPACGHESNVCSGWRYCPHCGAQYELYGINVDALIEQRRQADAYVNDRGFFCTLAATFLIACYLYTMESVGPFFIKTFVTSVFALAMFAVGLKALLTRRAKKKFPNAFSDTI